MRPRAKTSPRRRWLQTFGLWGLATGITGKGLSSLTSQERAQLEHGLARLGQSLDEVKNEIAAEIEADFTPQPEPTPPEPPQPTLQELHPEYYQGDYAQFLDNFSFRHIRTHEVIAPHHRTRGEVTNGLPPKELWTHITDTLEVADEIRHRLGSPLRYITSAYRTPEYNKQCGGAPRSYHTKNYALDLVYEAGSDAALEVALQLREEKFFTGGIGYYANFIHLDTRGYIATWEA